MKVWTPQALVAALDAALAHGDPVAMVTVIGTAGSAPRELGAKMLVHADGHTDGTIGGGTLEALAIQEAVVALATGRPRRAKFNLGYSGPRSIGMFCGGEVEVFVDVLHQPARIVVLGAGHVAVAVAQAAQLAGFLQTVVDERSEFANRERFPTADSIVVAKPELVFDRLGIDSSTYIIIVTHCHMQDMECLAKALTTPARYIGMIGSVTKVRQVYRRLARRNIDPGSDPRVHAPIGLKLGSSEPGHIAISILAEILKITHDGTGDSLREGVPVRRRVGAAPVERPAVRSPPVNVVCGVPLPTPEVPQQNPGARPAESLRSRSKKEAV